MELENKAEVLLELGVEKKKIIDSFEDKSEVKFSELVELVEVPKTAKKEFNKSKMFQLSRQIRELVNQRILTDNKNSIYDMDEVFLITESGKELILSDEEKIKAELQKNKNILESYKGIITSAENKIKELEAKLGEINNSD